MKALFFYSDKMHRVVQRNKPNHLCTIDGLPFTEARLVSDGDEEVSGTKCDDLQLVKVVKDVDTVDDIGIKYSTGRLRGRVKINGIIQ